MAISSRVRSGLPLFHRILRYDSPALAQISAASDRNPSLEGVRNFSTQAKDADAKVKVPLSLFGGYGNYASALFIAATKANALDRVESEIRDIIAASKNSPLFSQFIKDLSVPRETRIKAINEIFGQAGFPDVTKNFLVPNPTLQNTSVPRIPIVPAFDALEVERLKRQRLAPQQGTQSQQWLLQQQQLPLRPNQTASEGSARYSRENQHASSTSEMEQLRKQHQEVLQQIGLRQRWHLHCLRELQKQEVEQEEAEAARQRMLQLQGKMQQNQGSSSSSGMEIHHPGSMLVSMRPDMGIAMQPNPTENTSMAGISIGNEYAGPVFGQQQNPQQEQRLQQLLEFERRDPQQDPLLQQLLEFEWHDPQQEQLLQQLFELVRDDPQQETQSQQQQQQQQLLELVRDDPQQETQSQQWQQQQQQLLELQRQQEVRQQQREQLLQQQKELRRQRKYLLQQSIQRRPQQKQLQLQQQHKQRQQQQGYLRWRQQYDRQQKEQQQQQQPQPQQQQPQQQQQQTHPQQQQQQLLPQQQQQLQPQQQLRSPQIEPERLAIFNCLCSDLKEKRRSSENFLAVVSILLADQPEFLTAIEEAVNNGHL